MAKAEIAAFMKLPAEQPAWWAKARGLAARGWSVADIACRLQRSFQAVRYALDESVRMKAIAAVKTCNAKAAARRALVVEPPAVVVAPTALVVVAPVLPAGGDPEIARLIAALRLPPNVRISYVLKGRLPTFPEVRP
jgi:hypothetical protein